MSPDEDEKSTDNEEMATYSGKTSHLSAGKRESGGHSTGPKIRDTLTDIRRLTFLIEDNPELMNNLGEKISPIRELLYSWIPNEKGILLRPSMFQQYDKKNRTPSK